MRSNNTKIIADIGICIALALILSYFKLFRMPQGGEVSLEMLPLLILVLTAGFWPGLIGGCLFGIFHFFQAPFAIHPVQVLLDYPLAFGSLSVAALFTKRLTMLNLYIGVTAAVFLRFLFHCVSGYIFFKSYIPEFANPWFYSIVYNASYIIPVLLILYLLMPFIYRITKTRSLRTYK
ncbi:MAG: energy-coupled thiamine transporter ThiT [Armatimonadota bacterium]